MTTTAVKLEPAEWWELKARVLEADAAKAVAIRAKQDAEEFSQRAAARFDEVATKYDMAKDVSYTLDEATYSLVPIPTKQS